MAQEVVARQPDWNADRCLEWVTQAMTDGRGLGLSAERELAHFVIAATIEPADFQHGPPNWAREMLDDTRVTTMEERARRLEVEAKRRAERARQNRIEEELFYAR